MSHNVLDLESLKVQCKAAALGQLDWQKLLETICQWIDCPKAMLFNTNADGTYFAAHSYGHDLSMVSEYNRNYSEVDPRVKYSQKTKQGQTRTSQFYLPNTELEKTDYFNAVNVPAGVKDGLHSIILDNPAFGRQALGLHRSFEVSDVSAHGTDLGLG